MHKTLKALIFLSVLSIQSLNVIAAENLVTDAQLVQKANSPECKNSSCGIIVKTLKSSHNSIKDKASYIKLLLNVTSNKEALEILSSGS
jgi:hypothetical protein